MLAPFVLIVVLLALIYRLLRPPSPTSPTAAAAARPTRAQRLVAEVFEYAPAPSAVTAEAVTVLVLYATEYGFAKEVARRAAAALSSLRVAAAAGDVPRLAVRVLNVVDFACADFSRETAVLLVASTTGDGVAPHESVEMCDALVSGAVTFGEATVFGVLALGDRSYPHFCRGGRVLADALEKAARRPPLLPMGEVNQEDWETAMEWVARFGAAVASGGGGGGGGGGKEDYLRAAVDKYAAGMDEGRGRYTRANPYAARVVAKEELTDGCGGAGAKCVVRVEFDVEGAGVQWTAGDALGVMPRNNVERLLRALAAVGDETVVVSGGGGGGGTMAEPVSLRDALLEQLDLKTVRAELVDALGVATEDASERARAILLLGREPGSDSARTHFTDAGRAYADERHVLDVLGDFVGAAVTPGEIARLLRPLTARYYSISSTPRLSLSRIAVTVDVLRYVSNNTAREGVASTYLNDRVPVGSSVDAVGIFVSRNDNFRLPVDASKPVIMVGPGTGIAPFIAFIDERVATAASGRNLLFCGCRHEARDFLYRTRLEAAVAAGRLDLETAFSRDQPHKVYVQDRLRARGADVWQMIDGDGAHVYVCGDGRHMAPDVDEALRGIFGAHGAMDPPAAAAYLDALAADGRMQRDVWVP
jgi:sulfite reductase (NADPH) flavoprotein alpha-component